MSAPSQPDAGRQQPWSAQVNDLIGGWIVTTYPHSLAEHDSRKDGDPSKRGYVIAECMTETDALVIASLLNDAGVSPNRSAWVTDDAVRGGSDG